MYMQDPLIYENKKYKNNRYKLCNNESNQAYIEWSKSHKYKIDSIKNNLNSQKHFLDLEIVIKMLM